MTNAIWDRIAELWPVAGMTLSNYEKCEKSAGELLAAFKVSTVAFSHFGVVVHSINNALNAVCELGKSSRQKVKISSVEAYAVRVARIPLGEIELEIIEPYGKSFFSDHRQQFGESLHHVSFEVIDIRAALLKLSEKGVKLVDKEPRSGSHGSVAFTAPQQLLNMYLELFQAH